VVASSGGMAAHPSWFFNLVKDPDQVWIEAGGRKLRVVPEVLAGEEREQVWSQIKAVAPVYAGYEQKTDREIPIIRLTPASEAMI
jgi:deazaflavin-dependent oxidoreductase (nitroreductase family)